MTTAGTKKRAQTQAAAAGRPTEVPDQTAAAEHAPVLIAEEPAPAEYVRSPEEKLFDHLQRAETVASLLAMNFGGDGSFDEPDDAPGLKGMCALVAAELLAAGKLSRILNMQHDSIDHAAELAQYLAALSVEKLYGGKVGFRLGNGMVSMSYWTVETLTKQAYNNVSGATE